MSTRVIVLFVSFWLSGAVLATPPAEKLIVDLRGGLKAHEYVLPNGLTVVLVPNPKAPRANILHWVKAGSLHETPGITGIAHLFEHMMFRPVRKGGKTFSSQIQGLGGEFNASTRFLATLYTTSVPTENLKAALKIEAERFKNLKVTDDLLNVERKAVWSEYSTKFDNNPTIDLWASIYQQGFPKHPYGWMILGFREDLEKIKAEDCNKFFTKYYRPNNTGIFIVGDIQMPEVLGWVNQYYADWKRGEDSKLPPPYQGEKKAIIGKGHLKAGTPNVLMGYRIPEYTPENVHLLNLVNHIFFDSSLNLAKRRLVSKGIVSQIGGFNFDYDSGLIKAFAIPLPGHSTDEVLKEFGELRNDFAKLSDEQFEVYRRDYFVDLAENVLRSTGMNSRLALSWGKHGGITYAAEELKAPIPVTKKQVQDFVDQYFDEKNLVAVSSPE